MKNEFIPYEQALELKELGFDEPCFGWFTDGHLRIGAIVENKHVQGEGELLAPTFSQAFRWFRENYGLDYEITNAGRNGEYNSFVQDYVYGNNRNSPSVFSYEEAELACLVKLIEIVKNK